MQPPQVVKKADVKIGIGGLVAVAGGGWALCEVSRPLSNETTCTGGKINSENHYLVYSSRNEQCKNI